MDRQSPKDPRDLEPLLISRQHAADADGMAALYEDGARIDDGEAHVIEGREAIRTFFARLIATGRKFQVGTPRASVVCGDLALTSTRLPDGAVTAEVARRQRDGTWLWVIDHFGVASEPTSNA